MHRSKHSSLLIASLIMIASWQFGDRLEAQENATPVPTVVYTNGQEHVTAPDWSHITWSSLPPIQEGGRLLFPESFVAKMGYNPSRVWSAGQTPDSFTMLGDVTDAFRMEAFNLEDISGLTKITISSLTLKDFGLISWQTPKALLRAIPDLGDLPVSQVTPIRDLLEKVGRGSIGNEKVADIAQDNMLGNLALGKYLDLSKYKVSTIPGLTETPVGKFRNWQRTYINQVPGLNRVAFDQFPQSVPTGIGLVATADVVWSSIEHGDPNVGSSYYVSGSAKKNELTDPVRCEPGKPCAYLELSSLIGTPGSLHGKRWVSGKVQKVKGGSGALAKVNNGWEPTGRLVYGPAFKVVLTNANEVTGRADFALYLRYCHRYPVDLGCTPYFVGGIPWIPVKEGGTTIVAGVTAPHLRNIPSKYKKQIDEIERQNQHQEQPQTTDDTSPSTATGSTVQGEANTKIVAAINRVGSFSTANVPGTDGGQNACMWAVNNVLKDAGYAPLGNDTLAVREGQADLDSGRGQRIDIADAKPGDIVLVDAGGSRQHIGFCTTPGCSRTISNSSSKGEFSWNGNSNFNYPGSPYNGATPQVYRLEK